MDKLLCIDLFAGAGGLSEGFRQSGFEVISHVESDVSACETLKVREAYHYLKSSNSLEHYYKFLKKEISKIELFEKIPSSILNKVICDEISEESNERIFSQIDKMLGNCKVDVLIGGPPCQAYSLIGRARDKDSMKDDYRNYLYKEYIKYLEKYKPKVFVFENVKGLLSVQKGKLLDEIFLKFDDIDYHAELKVLNASHFGVLQNRERVFIIGWQKELEKFKYPDFKKKYPTKTIKELFSDLPNLNPGDNKYCFKRESDNELLSMLGMLENNFPYTIQHETRNHNSNDLEIYKLAVKNMNNGQRLKYIDIPKNLQTHKNKKSFLDRFKVVDGNGLSHTMVAHIAKDGHYYIHYDLNQNRSLSVREAARIQTFPEDFYFETSRTSAYRQIGNAVPPLMAKIISEEIKKQLMELI